MTFHVPAWIRSDPGAPPRLPAPAGLPGQVVALVATEGAVSGGWASEVALELAQGWSAVGARLVLADGGLEAPSLHLGLGEGHGEGLVDALRWGTSVRRVARRLEGRSFFAITAGTPVADGPAVLQDPRWGALCTGFREAGVTLAVLVPARDPCLGAVLGQAAAAVVLAGPGESIPLSVRAGKVPVIAVVGREGVPSRAAVTEQPASVSDELSPTVEATPLSEGLAAGVPPLSETLPEPGGPIPEPDSGTEGLPAGFADFTLTREIRGWEQPRRAEPPEAAVFPEPEPEPAANPEPEPEPAAISEPEPEAVVFPEPEPEAAAIPEPEPEAAAIPEQESLSVLASPEAQEASASAPVEFRALDADPELMEPEPLPPEPELYGDPVPTFEEIVEESEADSAPPRWANRRNLVGLGVLVVAVAAAVAASLLGYLQIPGLSPVKAEPGGGTPQAGTVAAAPATETSEGAPFSVGLAAFQDEEAARALVQDLSGRVPGVLFATVPVDVEGQVVHRVIAGVSTDSAAALALGARVAAAAGLAPDAWVARWTPRAFQLGEVPDHEAALRRSEVLQGLGVPAYVLAVTYSDGSVRFRVYAGAFADEAEALYLSGLLQERGLSSATLSERTGRLPE
ncbi:MAG TPA: SPOR domain-containing protein [Longimicrobiales bacterium]|nr:SPOR domain-containing protein [Longimicrobiales bacterium]